ncbi:MAG: hypothetical protein H6835_17855 [Planctomycetes bacterium]|nr:hypothetical protein [Planctomycetota bacterium]
MNRHLAAALAAALAGTTAAAQAPLTPPVTPIHTAADDLGIAYGVWAAGDRYKVSFHDGMTFVPYLGADYPRTQSLAWRTISARLGGRELLDDRAPDANGSGTRFEYRFGVLTEAYDVLPDGLEQSFVLRERPAVGDLVIRGALTTGLHAADRAAACAPLTFADEQGVAVVDYGRAVAIDAAGRRCDVTTALADGTVTLRVPGEWLADAALPVVVDPFVTTTVNFSLTSAAPIEVDIGRDDTANTDNVAVVYSKSVSASDDDLWVVLADDDFTTGTVVFSDVTTSWSTSQGRCAFVGGTDRWVVAFQRYFANTPTLSRIRAHNHASADTTLSTTVASLGVGSNENHWRPDVGGVTSTALGNQALIVFQVENNGGGDFAETSSSKCAAVLFDTTTTNGTFGSAFVLTSSLFNDSERPSVNQVSEGGPSSAWVCAFQRYSTIVPNDAWDIAAVRVAANGSITSGTWVSDYATAPQLTHQLGPVVEGQLGRYAVTFAVADATNYPGKLADPNGTAIAIERFDWYGGSAPTTAQAPVVLRSAGLRSYQTSGLAYDTDTGSHWTATSRWTLFGPSLAYDRVGFQGQLLESGTIHQTTTTPIAGGGVTFDNDHHTVLGAYGFQGGFSTIAGVTISYPAQPATTTSGVPCGTASLSWAESQLIGSEFSGIVSAGAPNGSVHLLVLADAGINVPLVFPGLVAPGCSLFVPVSGPDYLGMFPAALGGVVLWTLPLIEGLPAQTLHFQDWYLDPATGLLFNSPGLAVPIVK